MPQIVDSKRRSAVESFEVALAAFGGRGISGIFRGALAIKACSAVDGKGMPLKMSRDPESSWFFVLGSWFLGVWLRVWGDGGWGTSGPTFEFGFALGGMPTTRRRSGAFGGVKNEEPRTKH